MRVFLILLVALVLIGAGYAIYTIKIVNPEVAKELRADPQGARAQRVMLMTIDGGKTLPVNYLREDHVVYVGADGPWWREFRGEGRPVTLLIQGEALAGQARAVVDRPGFTKEVFARLRPAAPKWLPDWLNGVLIVIELEES